MNQENILEAKGIYKYYPGVCALDNVDISVRRGEVHALIGENGAGKSTLIKILSGSVDKDSGEIWFDNESLGNYTPNQAIEFGISVIYQEFNLIPHMTVEENLSLGRELLKGITLDKKAMLKRAKTIIDDFELDIDPSAKVSELSVAKLQMVEIVKALLYDSKLIIMDEPSASLTNWEMNILFRIIKELREKGKSVIYISHRLEEIFQIADRVTILRDGLNIKTTDVKDITRKDLIINMVGRDVSGTYPDSKVDYDDVVLRVTGLSNQVIKDVSFELHRGEVLGIGGLVGAGRTEIGRALFGADPSTGFIEIKDAQAVIHSPVDAIEYAIGLIPEERKTQGLLQEMSVEINLSLASLRRISKNLVINKKQEKRIVSDFINRLSIKTPSTQQLVKNLSGGNQQKVVVTKWLATECDILIFDEPTRGIDVGAKQEIYNIMSDLSHAGKSIIMISSELPELIGMSDRIIVMYEGKQMAILENKSRDISQEIIMALASGEEVHEVE